MKKISNPKTPYDIGHQARKRFGQNFLHDHTIIWQIVDSIGLKKEDNLLEIGPGLGALTEPMLAQVEGMTVIELDCDLANRLKIEIGANSHQDFTIINDNALHVDFAKLKDTINKGKLRVVGNLPYNISTPILFHLLNYADSIEDMHFMLQKEVVDRITASVGHKNYGRLSVMMQYYCHVEYLLTVPKGAFFPPPKVTSAVFRLKPIMDKKWVALDEKLFATIVRECFNHRRKTLRAIFKSVALLPKMTSEDFAQIDILEELRPENLHIKDFVHLSNFISKRMVL